MIIVIHIFLFVTDMSLFLSWSYCCQIIFSMGYRLFPYRDNFLTGTIKSSSTVALLNKNQHILLQSKTLKEYHLWRPRITIILTFIIFCKDLMKCVHVPDNERLYFHPEKHKPKTCLFQELKPLASTYDFISALDKIWYFLYPTQEYFTTCFELIGTYSLLKMYHIQCVKETKFKAESKDFVLKCLIDFISVLETCFHE